ncbi:hypothetical protein VKS41_000993 [Umbelopsis sp. WA50703]
MNFLALLGLAQSQINGTSMNLNTTWRATFPSSNITATSASAKVVSGWGTPNPNFFGDSNVAFIQDPYVNGTNSSEVLQVIYNKGSYTPKSSQQVNSSGSGGAEFYMQPFGEQFYDKALLTYSLAFDKNFTWVQGGKLPGLFAGPPGAGCSGGSQANGTNCFSMRMMWRTNGEGEAYAYIPRSSALCATPLVQCNDEYGASFSRGLIKFQPGVWTKIQMYVATGTPGQRDGVLKVWQDNGLVINRNDIMYRTSNMVQISSIYFSTFFGGSSESYATPLTTHTYFKDISLAVGNPVELSTATFASPQYLLTIILPCIIVAFFTF